MNHGHYILDDDHNVIAVDLMTWAMWLEDSKRVIKQDWVHGPFGVQFVSTVFLGLDHNFFDTGPPVLFETMLFNGPLNNYADRYRTWDEALTGHAVMCAKARAVRWAWRWLPFYCKHFKDAFEAYCIVMGLIESRFRALSVHRADPIASLY